MSDPEAGKISVLFVCLGNICRSTMAEAVFRKHVKDDSRVGRVDSVGTGAYHAGDPPDSRTMDVLETRGIIDYDHGARRISEKDFYEFNYILAMDKNNLRDLQSMQTRIKSKQNPQKATSSANAPKPTIALFGDYGGRKGEQVIDPYYGGRDGFETAYLQMVRFSQGFIKSVLDTSANRTS